MKALHLTLHTILQYCGVSCHLAIVKHLDLRLQEFDDLGTSKVARDSILSGHGSLLRVLNYDNWTSWHYLIDTRNSTDFRVGPRQKKQKRHREENRQQNF